MTLITVPSGFGNYVKDTSEGRVREAVNTVKHLYRLRDLSSIPRPVSKGLSDLEPVIKPL